MKNPEAVLLFAIGCGAASHGAPPVELGVGNEVALSERLIVGGQPDEAALVRAREGGVQQVISLRTAGEAGSEGERELARANGLRFVSIPVAGASGLTRENALALDAELRDGTPTLLHCGSGNRVGALLALRAFYVDGAAPAEALRLGEHAGLRGLREAVHAHMEEACGSTSAPPGCAR